MGTYTMPGSKRAAALPRFYQYLKGYPKTDNITAAERSTAVSRLARYLPKIEPKFPAFSTNIYIDKMI